MRERWSNWIAGRYDPFQLDHIVSLQLGQPSTVMDRSMMIYVKGLDCLAESVFNKAWLLLLPKLSISGMVIPKLAVILFSLGFCCCFHERSICVFT